MGTSDIQLGETRRPYIGVAVIVVRDGKILLGKRNSSHGAGTWQFPGGHLEFAETIEGCARRELFEETGLTIIDMRMGPFTNDFFEAENKHYVTLFAIAEKTSGSPRVKEPEKCEQWDWFKWSQMPKPYFLPIINLIRQNFSIAEQPSPAGHIKNEMVAMADAAHAQVLQRFFKTGIGGYGEGDIFLGIKVPAIRKLARRHRNVNMAVIEDLQNSPVHEHRHLALFLLTHHFEKAENEKEQTAIANYYLSHTSTVNNWDLVDCSAHSILGAFLMNRDRSVLCRLAESDCLWERRIAIVATWRFIKAGQIDDTFKLAAILLDDDEALIHKAVGWMLRETGKRDPTALVTFLATHYRHMPRTTLRYAIERFPSNVRKSFLKGEFDMQDEEENTE